MQSARIMVNGLPDAQPLAEAIQAVIPGTITTVADRSNGLDLDAIQATDVLINFIDQNHDPIATREVLQNVIESYPYLPVIVVGKPNVDDGFYSLGAARYLPADTDFEVIAQETTRTLRIAWWQGVSQMDFPVVVVDVRGRIIRANSVAESRFNGPLVGNFYRTAVEGADASELPAIHPIQETFETGKAVSRYHQYPHERNDSRRAHLFCRPVFDLRGGVQSVVVVFVDINRWARIFAAASRFSQIDTPEKLPEEIVTLAQELGYERVRLYRYDSSENKLRGKASRGFKRPNGENAFKSFAIDVNEDAPSQYTLEHDFPCLHVYQRKHATPRPEFGSDLVRWSDGSPSHEAELEKEEVNKFIDAPLIVRGLTEKGVPTCYPWGKLSIDRGAASDQLNTRDVTDIGVFASIAAGAIGVVQRHEDERQHLNLYREFSEQLTAEVSPEKSGKFLPRVLDLILDLYLRLTGADVVFYRQVFTDSLSLKGLPKWRNPQFSEELAVPQKITKGELFPVLKSSSPVTSIVADAKNRCMALLETKDTQYWTDREVEYLKFVGSEIHIPVMQGDQVRGLIVGVAEGGNVFTADTIAAANRFIHTVSILIGLAEFRDGRVWLDDVLREIMDVLPSVAIAPNDEAFFAAVATMLSAHNALGWNRVMIFLCDGVAPQGAELVYALGGLGNHAHSELQVAFENDVRFEKLQDLVNDRMDHPKPHWRGLDGELIEDLLFIQCVAEPRAKKDRIRIEFGPHMPFETADVKSPLRWLLEQNYSAAPSFPLPMEFRSEDRWAQAMNQKFPRMFCADTIYAFPIWSAHTFAREPLGVVLVDMHKAPNTREEDMKSATRVFLGLIGDILSSRQRERRLKGWVRYLPELRHGRELKVAWDDLLCRLSELLKTSKPVPAEPTAFNLFSDLQELQDAIQQAMQLQDQHEPDSIEMRRVHEEIRTKISNLIGLPDSAKTVGRVVGADRERLLTLLTEVNSKVNGLFSLQGQGTADESAEEYWIKNLGEYLSEFADACNRKFSGSLHVHGDWNVANGLELPCDRLVLNDALNCLIANSRDAARLNDLTLLDVEITASIEPPRTSNFEKIVKLVVHDSGPGVPHEIRPYIFMESFTYPGGSEAFENEKGRGLALTRAQLLAYHGDIQLEVPRHFDRTTHPMDGTAAPANQGATFVIRFGVPYNAHSKNLGARHGQVVNH